METQHPLEVVHPLGESAVGLGSQEFPSVFVDTFGGRVHVAWDPQAAVTPLGQLAFFIDFLRTAELWEPWVAEAPLPYTSNNAPQKVDVLGTLLLSVLAGHFRYAHVDSLRWDTVNPALLGMRKVVSASSARRAFVPADAEACAQWLQSHLQRCYEPLLYEPWILDVDTHVKVLYGHQEGAVPGYNPKKPGRPSHVLHTYFMANTRLVLDVEVRPGNETAAKYTMPGLWAFLDRLPREAWPAFLRGDCAFGNGGDMEEAEARGLDYLFKLRQTSKVKTLIGHLFSREGWTDAGQGWEGMESQLRLTGWDKARRVIVLRRQVKDSGGAVDAAAGALATPEQLALFELKGGAVRYEFAVLVTSLKDGILAVAQHYRDRGDAENNYDEQCNQWGWGGFTTQDMKRNQIMARIVALVYDWWSLFVGLAIPDRHAEAITSRPLLLNGVARQTVHGGQRTLTITSSHSKSHAMQKILGTLAAFLREVRATARQLSREERWRTILSRVFIRFLGGRSLPPPKVLPAPA